MQRSLPKESGWDFTMDSYDVVHKMEYPAEDKIEGYDAFIYTGSAASAHADVEWIHKLIEFTAHLAKNHPKVKIFGICFGHQIISLALGGTCVKNDGKWEVGPTKIRTSFETENELIIQEMHQDHCPFVPQGFHLLASTDISVNQGMVSTTGAKYHFTPTPESRVSSSPSPSSKSSSSFPLTDIHIITVQGHPEFTRSIVSIMAAKRSKQGIITDNLKQDVDRRNEALPNDKAAGDGEVIGRIFWKVLGV
ncbi:class I glutamine amidotransferase-like protein [Rhodocollybia butyracea]|uniref:Class I glutamine amidotransferase-like protein n=1 Tax=Rhodocollybia butyracea TaxID=206335 RepID=A0A9P5PY55_9AGAR|nr:class I glutamine amidotransferase-like protein [Rhodocollybia butyracea]